MNKLTTIARRRAEQILMETFGGTVRLGEGQDLGGSMRLLYGGDRQMGLFVMEDLKQRTRLDHLLLGNDLDAAGKLGEEWFLHTLDTTGESL